VGKPLRIHWAFVPAGAFWTLLVWHRDGPLIALITVVLGLSLAFVAEYRSRHR
jgi:hypothetical protein